jgi:hypothetical protein
VFVEGVERDFGGEGEGALRFLEWESGWGLCQVSLEPDLAFEVREDAFGHGPGRGQARLVLAVCGRPLSRWRQQRQVAGGEPVAVGASP